MTPVLVKIFIFHLLLFKAISFLHKKIQSGAEIFWLGILEKKHFDEIDCYYYNKSKSYSQKEYNCQGLFQWEDDIIRNDFDGCKKILLGGAGGGREVIALSKLGYVVDAFECNKKLVDFGNNLLKEEKIVSTIRYVKRDVCFETNDRYGGIILGWGMYMLIQGKKNVLIY